MNTPFFSVIIPTLNEEKFLPNLLASLAAQTKHNFEVIVVDGKSRDATVMLAKSFSKKLPKLTVIASGKRSVSHQRNLGAAASKGKWLVFVDSDGVFTSGFIKRADEFIKQKNPKLFTTWFLPDSDVSADALLTLLANMSFEISIVVKRQFSPGPLTVVDRQAFESVGGYNEGLAVGEDYDLGLRLDKMGYPLQILRETLFVYSLRRYRSQGTLKVLQQYAKGLLPVLITKSVPPNAIPGYVMDGGRPYVRKKPIKKSLISQYEKKLKELTRELFG